MRQGGTLETPLATFSGLWRHCCCGHQWQALRRLPSAITPTSAIIARATTSAIQRTPPNLFGPAERADHAVASPDGIGHLELFGGKLRDLWLQHPTPDEISAAMPRTIQSPVLVVVAGDHDEIKLEHAPLIHRSISQTGHATFALRPEWMNPMIESFLSEP